MGRRETLRMEAEREAALLFGACPRCLVGDLAIRRCGDAYIARCVACGDVGRLWNVYPLPGDRRRHLGEKRPAA